uniref:Uncharacterized protein n=1 Tax=Melicertus latisulcatus pemonivirus TaxID=2984278 RepID=A0A9C7CF05_9VIRU|nr:MAG: hypothetical protein [Melicertus latisulcatus pemonivirus]
MANLRNDLRSCDGRTGLTPSTDTVPSPPRTIVSDLTGPKCQSQEGAITDHAKNTVDQPNIIIKKGPLTLTVGSAPSSGITADPPGGKIRATLSFNKMCRCQGPIKTKILDVMKSHEALTVGVSNESAKKIAGTVRPSITIASTPEYPIFKPPVGVEAASGDKDRTTYTYSFSEKCHCEGPVKMKDINMISESDDDDDDDKTVYEQFVMTIKKFVRVDDLERSNPND